MSGLSLKNFFDSADSFYSMFTTNVSMEMQVRANMETSQALRKLGFIA